MELVTVLPGRFVAPVNAAEAGTTRRTKNKRTRSEIGTNERKDLFLSTNASILQKAKFWLRTMQVIILSSISENEPCVFSYLLWLIVRDISLRAREYVARSRTRRSVYYHCLYAQSLQLIDNQSLTFSNSPFKPLSKTSQIMPRRLRKKFIFFSSK